MLADYMRFQTNVSLLGSPDAKRRCFVEMQNVCSLIELFKLNSNEFKNR